MLEEVFGYVNEVVCIYFIYKQVYFIKGNIFNYLKCYDELIEVYQCVQQIDFNYQQVFDNMMIIYCDVGCYYGE